MNAEVEVQLEDGRTLRYSITPDGEVYEIRHSGWRKVTSPYVRKAVIFRLAIETSGFNA